MTRKIVPFKSWHMEWLEAHSPVGFVFGKTVCEQLETQNSWSAVLDGEVIACGGTIEQWPGRHTAWAHLGPHTAPHMRWITREADRVIAKAKGRVEMTARCDFEAGHRWAELLGFRLETPIMAAFGPEGEDHSGYIRINR